jgi:phosphoribosylaminoimidazole-succinocarboxamide synthase
MDERFALATENSLPLEAMMDLSKTYLDIAAKITGAPIMLIDNPKAEIIKVLKEQYQLVD